MYDNCNDLFIGRFLIPPPVEPSIPTEGAHRAISSCSQALTLVNKKKGKQSVERAFLLGQHRSFVLLDYNYLSTFLFLCFE